MINNSSTSTIEFILQLYSDTLSQLQKTCADIPDSRMTEQPQGNINHPAWTLGHLVGSSNFILLLLGEDDPLNIGEQFKNFGPGSTPSTNPAEHLPKSTLLNKLSEIHALVITAVREKHAEYFNRPSPDYLQKFAPTLGKIIVYLLAAHESYHIAQLVQWRRGANLSVH